MTEIALDSILATSRCIKESNSQRKTAKAQMDLYLYHSQAATNYLPTALNTSQRKTRQGLYQRIQLARQLPRHRQLAGMSLIYSQQLRTHPLHTPSLFSVQTSAQLDHLKITKLGNQAPCVVAGETLITDNNWYYWRASQLPSLLEIAASQPYLQLP